MATKKQREVDSALTRKVAKFALRDAILRRARAGVKIGQIAVELDVSKRQIREILNKALTYYTSQYGEHADRLKALNLHRLEALYAVAEESAIRGTDEDGQPKPNRLWMQTAVNIIKAELDLVDNENLRVSRAERDAPEDKSKVIVFQPTIVAGGDLYKLAHQNIDFQDDGHDTPWEDRGPEHLIPLGETLDHGDILENLLKSQVTELANQVDKLVQDSGEEEIE